MSKTLSISPDAFSKDMDYENPEQPPPTKPTRRPAGTGVCCPMISLTLVIAVGVSEMGAFLVVSCGRTSGVVGTVVVDMALLRCRLIITDAFRISEDSNFRGRVLAVTTGRAKYSGDCIGNIGVLSVLCRCRFFGLYAGALY